MRTMTVLMALSLLASGLAPAADPSLYEAAVAAAERPAADRERDANRKPADVLEFAGIEPGMTVLDLFSGGGYYSELLSYVVGPDGHVLAHSNEAYKRFVGDEFDRRFGNDRLPNVEILMAENNELSLDAGSIDAIMLVLSFHDLYYADAENGWPKIDVDAFLAELHKGLRPGGTITVIDHAAPAGAPSDTGGTVHRIDPAIVVARMTAAGFVLDARSDLLRNPDDDYEKVVFDPAVRGRTDRFAMRFHKAD